MVRIMVTALVLTVACAAWSTAQVTGKVTLDGEAPEMDMIDMSGVKECNAQHPDPVSEETVVVGENGELANVAVYVRPAEGEELEGAAPKQPAVLDQKGCIYTPHVLAMMVGQDMVIKNSDPFLHNVHSLAETNPSFNFGQPNKDAGKKVEAPKAAETYKVKCDVHPWMGAWVVVLEHPYFAVTGEKGTFSIKGLPDGEYTFVAWHEKYGEQEQTAEVKGGKAEVNFTFDAASAQAPAAADVKIASDDQKDCAPSSCCPAKSGDAAQVKAN